jgi:hypothetical protein
MYLLTNDATTQCGIYEIPLRRVEFETGFSGERIYEMFHKFQQDGKIQYSMETREIAMINWLKYNANPSPKSMQRVADELENVKNPLLVLLLYNPSEPLLEKHYKTGTHVLIKNPWETYFLERPELTQNSPGVSPNTRIMPHRRGMQGVSMGHPQYSDSDSDSDSKQIQTQNTEPSALVWKTEKDLCRKAWKTFEKIHNAFIPDQAKEVDAINKLIHMASQSGDTKIILVKMMETLMELKENDTSKNGFWRTQPYLPSTLVSQWSRVWEEAKIEAHDEMDAEGVTF